MKTTYKLIIGLLLLFILSVTFYFVQKVYNRHETLTKQLVKLITLPDGSDKVPVLLKDLLTLFPIGNSKVYFEGKYKNGILKIDSKNLFHSLKIKKNLLANLSLLLL